MNQPANYPSQETELKLTPRFRSKPIPLSVKAMEPFTLQHELGRVPAGWLVIDTSSVVNVWRSGVMDTTQLILTADQDADITLVLL